MGNQIKKLTSISNAHKNGFMRIDTNVDNNFSENEIYGYQLPIEPESRDYYFKCPRCQKIIVDNGINESIECDNCKNLVEIPDNNFNEIKKEYLYPKSEQKKCFAYLKCINCMNTIYRLLPFSQTTKINTPAFKSINLIVNRDKIREQNILNENNNVFIDLMHNVIIPFFQFKSRLLHKGKIFKIGDYEFKVSSTTPNLISGKITSLTLIRCNEFYSNLIPIKEANIITCKKYENKTIQELKEKIYSTPYKSQLSISNNTLTRINSIDIFIRNCVPNYGVINNETNLKIQNKNIDQINSLTLAIIKNDNSFLNDKKNQNIILERYYKPYFLSGMQKYIERGDIIKIGEIRFFVLKSNPENGFISSNSKILFKFGKTEEQLKDKLNYDLEIERERRNNRRQNNDNDNSNNNNSNNEVNTSSNNRIEIRFSNRIQTLHDRLRLLNELFLDRDLFYLDIDLSSSDFFKQQKAESVIRGLPKFKIDKKYLSNLEKLGEEYTKKCVICMENYKENDEVETLPCFHIFHKDCIEEWFNNNNNNCPICKNDITNEGI
jgi:ribosomal protein S27E